MPISTAGRPRGNERGFADRIKARAAGQGRPDGGFADRIKARAAGQGRPDGGFSYVMVLAAVVVVGIVAEVAHLTTWRIVQADREAELLFRGLAYRRAIESYYQSNGSYPRSLEDLVKDPRSPSRRHLRALYPDPLGKGEKKDWLLVRSADGGISGVVSSSTYEPLKRANFPKEIEKFAGAKTHADWVFEFTPAGKTPAASPKPPPAPASAPVPKAF